MNSGETHLIPLFLAIMNSSGCVVELGMGNWSTKYLHRLADHLKFNLISIENDRKWAGQFRRFVCDFHIIYTLDKWSELDRLKPSEHVGVVLVDQRPAAARNPSIRLFADADILVVHDSEHPHYNYDKTFGLFKYRTDYNLVTPTTTLLSNVIDVSQISLERGGSNKK